MFGRDHDHRTVILSVDDHARLLDDAVARLPRR
jgi:hypothetical protein